MNRVRTRARTLKHSHKDHNIGAQTVHHVGVKTLASFIYFLKLFFKQAAAFTLCKPQKTLDSEQSGSLLRPDILLSRIKYVHMMGSLSVRSVLR